MARDYLNLLGNYYYSSDPFKMDAFLALRVFLGQHASRDDFVHFYRHLHTGYTFMEMAVIFNLVDHQDYLSTHYSATVEPERVIEICAVADGRFCYDMVRQAIRSEEPHLASYMFEVDECYVFKITESIDTHRIESLFFKVTAATTVEGRFELWLQWYSAQLGSADQIPILLSHYLTENLRNHGINFDLAQVDSLGIRIIVSESSETALRACFHRCQLQKNSDVVPQIYVCNGVHSLRYTLFNYDQCDAGDVMGTGAYSYLKVS